MNYIKFLFTFSIVITSLSIFADEAEDTKNLNPTSEDTVNAESAELDEEKKETIESYIEDNKLNSTSGFFNILINEENDDHFLVLNKDDLNKEFIYFTYFLDAPQASGQFGGALSDGSILEFREFKNEIGLYKKNTKFIY